MPGVRAGCSCRTRLLNVGVACMAFSGRSQAVGFAARGRAQASLHRRSSPAAAARRSGQAGQAGQAGQGGMASASSRLVWSTGRMPLSGCVPSPGRGVVGRGCEGRTRRPCRCRRMPRSPGSISCNGDEKVSGIVHAVASFLRDTGVGRPFPSPPAAVTTVLTVSRVTLASQPFRRLKSRRHIRFRILRRVTCGRKRAVRVRCGGACEAHRGHR